MISTNPLHILYASRLVEEKGVDILMQVISHSLEKEMLITWHIASDGAYQSQIIELASRFPESIIYHGKCTQGELADLYRCADFLFMPSRFLETFGLTALESLACGTPVIGFRKGGLRAFISPDLDLDRENPVGSFFQILQRAQGSPVNVSSYSRKEWIKELGEIFEEKKIYILHDYHEKIGGAEYYVADVESTFRAIGKSALKYSYGGSTTVWKRRILFICSLLAVWRKTSIARELETEKPDAIWMHSILRYIGYWGVCAVREYTKKYPETKIYLSHHDVGLLAPFPQSVTEESQIPLSFLVQDFLTGVRLWRRILASVKWCYIALIRDMLPENTLHIIFSSFLEEPIRRHFPGQKIRVFPHSYDEEIFHP